MALLTGSDMSVINSGPKRKNYSDHSSYSYSRIGPKERALISLHAAARIKSTLSYNLNTFLERPYLYDVMQCVIKETQSKVVCLVFQVSFSNSQAKKLAIYLATFERHIDAVERPNLDKEVFFNSINDFLNFLS